MLYAAFSTGSKFYKLQILTSLRAPKVWSATNLCMSCSKSLSAPSSTHEPLPQTTHNPTSSRHKQFQADISYSTVESSAKEVRALPPSAKSRYPLRPMADLETPKVHSERGGYPSKALGKEICHKQCYAPCDFPAPRPLAACLPLHIHAPSWTVRWMLSLGRDNGGYRPENDTKIRIYF